MPLELVIPDLLLTAGATARLAAARLPHAEKWLARAEVATEPGPYAAVALLGEGREAAGQWLRADPVHLRIDQDSVVLHDAAVLDLGREEAEALAGALREHFARDGLALEVTAPQRWYVRVPAGEVPTTVPLERAAGHNVFGLLPRGTGRINWPALLTEAQMLLAQHPANEAREPAKPAVNGVWFWGEGRLPDSVAQPYALVYAHEPFALGLARLTGAEARDPPASIAEVDLVRPGDSALVVLDALGAPLRRGDEDAWLAAAQALDERWFAGIEKAVARFGSVRIVLPAGDRVRVATITPSARWRWFRARKPLAAHA